MNNYNLEPDDLKILLNAYDSQRIEVMHKLKKLADEVKVLDIKIDKVKMALTSMNESEQDYASQPKLPGINGYERDWTWNEKIRYILSHNKRPMTRGEIVEEIIQHEPEFVANKKALNVSISATLSAGATKKGYYRRINVAEGNMKYDLN
jgi:hypothetical protein